MENKKYMDIVHVNEEIASHISEGDYVVIQEKIDGANASFLFNPETNSIVSFSRNKELSSDNTLRGFYEWLQKLDVDKVKSVIGERYKIFGEWLVSHTVKYPAERYNNFYMYDVWDIKEEKYLLQDKVKNIADELNLIYVPVFYEGEFKGWKDAEKYLGKTQLGGEIGEGIIIKDMKTLNDDSVKTYSYLKLVSEQFRETANALKFLKKKRKSKKPKIDLSEDMKTAESIIKKARVEKIINKMVDDEIISENWGKDEISIIMKNIGKFMYEDCLKENKEEVNKSENFGKVCNIITLKLAKEIISERSL